MQTQTMTEPQMIVDTYLRLAPDIPHIDDNLNQIFQIWIYHSMEAKLKEIRGSSFYRYLMGEKSLKKRIHLSSTKCKSTMK